MMEDNKKRKIRIVFIIDTFVGFAGTEKHLFDIVSHLNKEIFTCYVISFNTNEIVMNEFKKIGITILAIPLEKIYNLNALKKFFILYKNLKKIGPDIVQTFHFKSDTFGVLAAKTSNVPCIISSKRDHGDMKKRSNLLLNRLMNHLIDRFIAVCNATSKSMQEKENIPSKRIHVIYNGVDTQKFHLNGEEAKTARMKLGISIDAFVVGLISNFRPEKDIPTFFNAMAILQKEIRNLRIIASGCGVAQFQKRIGEQMMEFCSQNNLLSRTLFPGYVHDVRPYISVMDVACLTPIKNEGFSNAILEEMAMGKPVVATDVGGNAESVLDGETGFIVQPGNPEQLAEKILFLFRNPDVRERMGRKARQRIEKYFSLERMIRDVEAFYTS